MLNFKLKTVGKIMLEHELTEVVYDGMTNGLDAMFYSWKIYNNFNINIKEKLYDVILYNEKDCLIMKEIHRVLKNFIS
jgi:hypothetical protein